MPVVAFYGVCGALLLVSALCERSSHEATSEGNPKASVALDALIFGLCLIGVIMQRKREAEREED